jgi:hypothetical protein
MPGYEIRSEVTAIGTVATDPALFAIPSGYQKVQPPIGGDNQSSALNHQSFN